MPSSNIEHKIRAKLPLIRIMQDFIPLPVANWLINQGRRRVRLDPHFTRESVTAAGVECEWVVPANSPKDRVLLYLHGGGFVFGLSPLHLEMVAYLANKMNTRALLVNYRLAPKHPFPAPLEDCVAVYRWLLYQGVDAKNIVVAGDSAGGNLTITTLMKIRDDGDRLPAAAACLSPVADLSSEKPAPQADFEDPMLSPRSVDFYNRSYLAGNDAHCALISPLFGDWRNLPPLLVQVGDDEILRSDAIRIEEAANTAGVDVHLEIFEHMWHVWQLYLKLPQAIQSLDEIARFLRSHLGTTTH
jgi:acetyl esterase/lipase